MLVTLLILGKELGATERISAICAAAIVLAFATVRAVVDYARSWGVHYQP